MLAPTSSHSSSSPGVESNQSNVTCFDLIKVLLDTPTGEVARSESAYSHWMDSTVTLAQPTVCLLRISPLDFFFYFTILGNFNGEFFVLEKPIIPPLESVNFSTKK